MVNAKVMILSALAGIVAAGEYAEPPHHSEPTHPAHSTGTHPHGNHTVTTTKVVSRYTTWCPEPTTVCIGSKTYTVTKPTTLTITDCPCTITETHNKPTQAVTTPVQPVQPTKETPPPPPVKPTSPVVVAGAEGRAAAYGFAMAAAGFVGAVAL
ncbi:hypothetical protein JDV02_000221 [Purpureocillium takamizusanense]|uniref:Cell wall protein SED1 n=1 Tax=Purpureocillium takamizusanense TaxID=2060973 RepID=A0A9Q8Q4C4_9HYPO|nr:uncharacterized protein JDV02_000221 [Purpureocillium takamizusanense]UNI13478.1 hypothetical protein JDV02_000221 [Purpureocillium takamizusanense]